MAILNPSPRSYITEAFDMFFPAFTEYVYNTLSDNGKRSDWWKAYVYRYSDRNLPNLPPRGREFEIFCEKFDEYYLLTLITRDELKVLFSPPEIIDLSEVLLSVRNEWAHKDGDLTLLRAITAVKTMIDISEKINYTNIYDKLVTLLNKMKPIVCSRNDLINFLENNILSVVENSPIFTDDREAQEIIKRSRKKLMQTETADEVVEFFKTALVSKGYAYKIIKKYDVTFEELSDDFYCKCYGISTI
jgi:hypothetical protein